jgi:hypothetical protein
MSVADLWADVYKREVKVTRTLRDRLCLEEIRVQQLESQRRTMLSLLTLAAKDLRDKSQPFGATLEVMITELRNCYVEEFVIPASAPTSDQAAHLGSASTLLQLQAVSPGAVQVRVAPVHTEQGESRSAPF